MKTPEYKEEVGACAACGNSPTPHGVQFCIATTGMWGARAARYSQRNAPLRLFLHLCRVLTDMFEQWSYRIGYAVGLIKSSTDVTRARSYRSQVVWEEAVRRGIPMEQLIFVGSYTDVYRAQIAGDWFYFESLPIPLDLEQGSYLWIDDKYLLNETLRKARIPVPYLASVKSEHEAAQAFLECHGRAVAKPRIGSRGRHTTTNIRTEHDMRAAFRSAQKLGRYVCITRHLEGSVCRGTVVQGRLAGFFQADPPRVEGDGSSTIRQLIAGKNAMRHERVQPIELREEHDEYIARAGHSRDSILPKGTRLDLTHRTGRLFGGETRELLVSVHPKLRFYLEKAAATLDVPVVGFDLIVNDPEADPDTQEWGIIEANSLPFIDLHYLPLHGEPSNVAAHVWDLWKKGEAPTSQKAH